MSSKLLVLPALVAGVLFVTACSGGSTDGSGSPGSPSSVASTSGTSTSSAGPSGSSGTGTDACSVLTTEDIAQEVGGVVSAGTAATAQLCNFTVLGSSKLGTAGAVTDLFAAYGAEGFKAAKTGLVTSGAATEESGIGDDAIYTKLSHSVVFVKGEKVVTVSIIAVGGSFDTDDSAWHDAVVALAKTAAGRI